MDEHRPNALKTLLASLKGSRDGVLPSIQSFAPLDVNQIANELRVEARGTENGAQNHPVSESEVEDAVEGDIRAEIERRIRNASENYGAQLNLYDGRIRRALVSVDQTASIESAGENALADFKVQVIADRNFLDNARREVEGREREFAAFRAAHRLVRHPKVVHARERIARGLLLAICVALESILNGFFFARGSDLGIIGGVAEAFVLSILNIGGSVLYAQYGLKLLVHNRLVVRAVGVLVTIAYAFWAIGLNLAIGHFRDLYVSNAGHVAVADITARLSAAPLGLADVQSLMLVVLGIGLALVALIDAAGLDDVYPGYGAAGRRRMEAVFAYADESAGCFAGLAERRDEATKDLSNVLEWIKSSELDLRRALEGRTRLSQEYRAYVRELADNYIQLVRRYRDANSRARSTPGPDRFQRPPGSSDLTAAAPQPPPPEIETRTASARLTERMEHFIRAINKEYEAAAGQYETVERLAGRGA
jgi:hypothetical protein